LLTHFLSQIEVEEGELSAMQEADPDADAAGATQYIQKVPELLAALGGLIGAFPDIAREQVPDFNALVFRYLTFGAAEVVEEGDGVDGESDDEIEADAAMQPEEADEQMATGDDTWNIRKAAIGLGTTLIKEFPEEFFEALAGGEEGHVDMLRLIIRDSDVGVQKDALEFVQAVAGAYRERFDSEIYQSWFAGLVSELGAEKPAVTGLILEAICVLQ
jgi:hypothetical protein